MKDWERKRRSKRWVVTTIYHWEIHSSIRRWYEKPKYTRTELYEWCIAQDLYHELYGIRKSWGYKKNNKPSIDRINDYKSYTLDNIQLMTCEQNIKKEYNNRIIWINNKTNCEVVWVNVETMEEVIFHSAAEATRVLAIDSSSIIKCCHWKRETAWGYKWTKTLIEGKHACHNEKDCKNNAKWARLLVKE